MPAAGYCDIVRSRMTIGAKSIAEHEPGSSEPKELIIDGVEWNRNMCLSAQ